MREPLDMVSKHGIKEMHWLWSPGGGKTTGIEGAIQWRMVNAPSNILVVGQKDDTGDRWMETRLVPSIKKNPQLRDLLPSSKGEDRHRMRKSTIIFNHGFYLDAVGSAESNLQEKSMPLVIMDEAWKLSEHPGRIQQAKQRTHDKWNSMILYAGQAGDTHYDPDKDDALADLYREYKKSDQRTFSWCCPKCNHVQPYQWSQMKWDKVEVDGYGIDWNKTAETIRMECVNDVCDAKYPDDVKSRRLLAETGRYVVTNPYSETGIIGYHANAMSYWRIPWLKLVKQFEEAMEAKYKGDNSLLRIFVIQRLAEFWKPGEHEEQHELQTTGYRISDFEGGELIEGEEARGMAIDVQMADLWFTVAAFSGEPRIQVLNCGQMFNFDEVEETRKKYKINPPRVLVDCRFRKNYVLEMCAKYGYTAYMGVERDEYKVTIGGEVTNVPYSNTQVAQSGSGKKAILINFCVNQIKDVIAEIRAGRMGELVVPIDVDKRFREHLNAEKKAASKDNKRHVWKQIAKRPNHMLDNLMALTGFGMVKGLIRTNKQAEQESKDDT